MIPDITGRTYHRLLVIKIVPGQIKGKRRWVCDCVCGNVVEVSRDKLTTGNTKSCGCLKIETARARRLRHGATAYYQVCREYSAWQAMIRRCEGERRRDFRFYGGRGITVCAAWRHDFPTFLRDVGECPSGFTLDRIDPNGHYEPGNVRWADWSTQRENRRQRTHNPMAVINLAATLGIHVATLSARLRQGFTVDQITQNARLRSRMTARQVSAFLGR